MSKAAINPDLVLLRANYLLEIFLRVIGSIICRANLTPVFH